MEHSTIKLTEYSRSAGCGCKIAPAVLEEILKSNVAQPNYPNLLIGNSTKDDAAVLDIGNGKGLISTTDFFMPIVNNGYDFGRVAAANAISDVYAMGGKPVMALAILGWPIDKLPLEMATQVMEGARAVCMEAGIPLAGGHSIDSAEPIFGLSVNGLVDITNVKANSKAQEGDLLFLTKPIGIGLFATAEKRNLLQPEDQALFLSTITQLNKIGEQIGKIDGVHAMTDVTGFGLGGHLIEMAEGSGLSAYIEYSKIPLLENAKRYLTLRTIPDATYRNWNGYGKQIEFAAGVDVMEAFNVLPDPQTNGGLLLAVSPDAAADLIKILDEASLKLHTTPIGYFTKAGAKTVFVQP